MLSSGPHRHPLERLLSPLEHVPIADGSGEVPASVIECRPGRGTPEWLTAGAWRVFVRPDGSDSPGREVVRWMRRDGTSVSLTHDPGTGRVVVPFSLGEAYEAYVTEAWTAAAPGRRVSPRQLDRFYRVKAAIPRSFQLALRRGLIRWQGAPEFPSWPFDDSVGRLLRLYVRCALLAGGRDELRFRWFWPGGARAAVVLTHDIESAEGLTGALAIAEAEERRGLRSSFNVVASQYPIDWGIVRELTDRGFEIGVHGVFHDRSMFASRSAFETQQSELRDAARRLGASGFRSPATHRVHAWLSELPVDYDCTVPLSDPYEPQPGGCCSPWPYFLGRIVELPWTLPQDHTLFTLLRERSIARWVTQLEALEQVGGLVQCLSHPDPGYLGEPGNAALYGEFLDVLRDRPGLWRALPRDVAAWWRARDAAEVEDSRAVAGVARYDPERAEVELAPAVG